VLLLPPLPADAAAALLAVAALLPHCLRRSAGAATLLPPPTRRQAERKLPPPPHFRLVARHAAAKLPPPPPRTPRENRMTPMDPQKGGKTSSLAAAKRGRGKRPKRRWGKIPRPKVFHVDTKVFHVYTKINLSAPRKIYLRTDKSSTWSLICAQIKISGYTNKFCGHFVMFSCLLANKNKIPSYESTNEQPRTKQNITPVICVSAYLSAS
jgi:hypothetical protein